jgi:hypothetical protein
VQDHLACRVGRLGAASTRPLRLKPEDVRVISRMTTRARTSRLVSRMCFQPGVSDTVRTDVR